MYIILTEVLKWKIIKFLPNFVYCVYVVGFLILLHIHLDQGYLVKVNERVHGQNIQVTKHFYILDELWSWV